MNNHPENKGTCEVIKVTGCSAGPFITCKTHGWNCPELKTHPLASDRGDHILFQNAK